MATNYHSRRFLVDPATNANGSGNGSGANPLGAYNSTETNFDTNMVIILAALLCALICALGLNSIIRCALRCGRRIAFETPDQEAARTGLKKHALRQIPIAVYGPGANIPATECAICLGDFEDGEKIRVLPKCYHGFHVRCIDTWLMAHSSCPTCRHSLLERPTPLPLDAAVLGGVVEAHASADHDAS